MRLKKPCSVGNRTSPTNRRAARISWVLWNGPIPGGLWLLHHCDTPQCDEITHLYLGTPKDNTADMDQRGRRGNLRGRRMNSGEDHWKAKLSQSEVDEIRQWADRLSVNSLASIYEVHRSTISRIISKSIWRPK